MYFAAAGGWAPPGVRQPTLEFAPRRVRVSAKLKKHSGGPLSRRWILARDQQPVLGRTRSNSSRPKTPLAAFWESVAGVGEGGFGFRPFIDRSRRAAKGRFAPFAVPSTNDRSFSILSVPGLTSKLNLAPSPSRRLMAPTAHSCRAGNGPRGVDLSRFVNPSAKST